MNGYCLDIPYWDLTLLLYCRWISSYQEGGLRRIEWFRPTTHVYLSKAIAWISDNVFCVLVLSEWRWTINICRIVDNQLLNFLFILTWSSSSFLVKQKQRFVYLAVLISSLIFLQLSGYVQTFLTTFYCFLILMSCKKYIQ